MIKILIIDDNQDHVYFLKQIFTEKRNIIKKLKFDEPFKIYKASTGIEGIKMAQLHEPDVVILEQKLKGMSGLEICKAFKALKGLEKIPIIFHTAIQDPEQKEKAFQMGASDYLEKPVQPYELLMKIKRHIELYHLQLELQRTFEIHEKDLNLARNLQKRLLPTPAQYKNIKFDYLYIPSHSTSGDMAGIIPLSDNENFVYIYDISGHGLTSSLLSIIVKEELEKIVVEKKEKNLKKVILALEKSVTNYFGDDMYFTGIFAILSKEKIQYANFAHREIIFITNNEITTDEFTNFPLGIGLVTSSEQITLKEQKITPDTKIALYTDGLVEFSEKFATEKLYKIITQNLKTPEQIIPEIENAIKTNLNPPRPPDDITFLILSWKQSS
ncbi:serine phosphatase RsbU, regulator of sigma subunit [Marinitoga piezophila KA3]|uniref:Serine phosphatase RsbU, regulator of sigma subunit n=1 Tax=Marinitoga piezophila (strain DSM 14283 / JCM 11233 / KA3) TaxID=443254 RepID=H2J8C3_MARPK|nr:SpoIIE family protein phosphatase [Marinitoga piezophila]AEX85607.1 serine phosphatase RsbU, regulator of sigma subunit [Marinitoga piezophila KA3]